MVLCFLSEVCTKDRRRLGELLLSRSFGNYHQLVNVLKSERGSRSMEWSARDTTVLFTPFGSPAQEVYIARDSPTQSALLVPENRHYFCLRFNPKKLLLFHRIQALEVDGLLEIHQHQFILQFHPMYSLPALTCLQIPKAN